MFNAQKNKSPIRAHSQSQLNAELELLLMKVRAVRETEQKYVIPTLTLAFAQDPVMRWFYPDTYQYITQFPPFAQALGGQAFAQNTALTNGNYAAAALWLPPGITPNFDLVIGHLQQSTFEANQPDLLALLEQIDHYHPPFPHWYLSLIGAEPIHQGCGYGSALLQQVLQRCDRARLPAYLEASNPKHLKFYEHRGFVAIGQIQAGSSPVILPMLRQPQ